MKIYIYTLADPVTHEIRYIGKSKNLKRRYYNHVNLASLKKRKCYLSSWLISLLQKELKPIIEVIDEIEGDWEWLEEYWISQFKTWGFRLVNLAEGGQGGNNYKRSEATKQAISKNNARGNAKLIASEVILICQLINQNKKLRYIKKKIPHLTSIMLYSIRSGKKWKHITSKYLQKPFKLTPEIVKHMVDLHNNGKTYKDISLIIPMSKSRIGTLIKNYNEKQ